MAWLDSAIHKILGETSGSIPPTKDTSVNHESRMMVNMSVHYVKVTKEWRCSHGVSWELLTLEELGLLHVYSLSGGI